MPAHRHGKREAARAFCDLTPDERARAVKDWARELGFDLVGVAEAKPLAEARAVFGQWLAEGRHADMQWLARDPERRCDPARVLPGCRSVIICAANYHCPSGAAESPTTARVLQSPKAAARSGLVVARAPSSFGADTLGVAPIYGADAAGAPPSSDLGEVESISPGSRRIPDATLGHEQSIPPTPKGSHSSGEDGGKPPEADSQPGSCDPFRVENDGTACVCPGSADPGLLDAIPSISGARAASEAGESPPREEEPAHRGRVAQYARFADYHKSLGKRARALARRLLDAAAGDRTVARAYVDTGPVLEKAWAQRAGVGFVGKNTCVIHPRRGSWFLLATVLTTFEIAADAPAAEACGACRRCIDACPTGAIVAPGVLDARRCVSYLTIEHRGPFDETPGAPTSPASSALDGWLFGCDACQEVCPYNRKFSTPVSADGPLGPPIHPESLDLRDVLRERDNDAFLDWLGRASPLRRAGRDGLRRNALALSSEAR